jgi:hypothetical protein
MTAGAPGWNKIGAMGAETGPKIVEYARSKRRTKVGSGECFDLAVAALKEAGSKTAYDFGEVTADGDYTWGSEIGLTAVQPGDVLQYRDYLQKTTREIETSYTFADGATLTVSDTSTSSVGRPHHTAIATAMPANGAVKVIEQNVERALGHGLEKLVDDGEIYLQSVPKKTTTKTESVRIDVAWGVKVKRLVGPKNAAAVDAIAKKNLGKSATAEVTTDETITVSGTLKAYRAQPK